MNPGSAHVESYSDLPDDCKITKEEEFINIILSSDKEFNKLDSLSRLIKKGVDINFKSPRCNNNTALHLAVLKQELKVIELLISHGADTSIENNTGETPLSLAGEKYRQYIDEILNRSAKTNNMLMRPIGRHQGDVYEKLKLFVKHFVKGFELKLLVYRDILEGGAEKAGIYSDTFANATSKLTGGTIQSTSGHLFGETEAGARTRLSAGDKNGDNENDAIEMRQTLYVGQTYPDISKYLHNLGRMHFILGDPAKAVKYMKYALEMRQALYPGQNHSEIAESLHELGKMFFTLGDVANTVKYNKNVLEMRQVLYHGKDHPDIAESLHDLGRTYSEVSDHGKALELYKDTLEMRRALYPGKGHPDIAESLHDLGRTYSEVGDHGKALEFYKDALEMRRALYHGKDHPDIAESLHDLGLTYSEVGDYAKALELHKDALKMRRALALKQNYSTIAKSLYDLVGTFDGLGDQVQYKKGALKMTRILYSEPNHSDIAEYLNDLGKMYFALCYHTKALEHQQDTLGMRNAPEIEQAQCRQQNQTKIKQKQKMSLGKIQLSGKGLDGFKLTEEIQKNLDELYKEFRNLSIKNVSFEQKVNESMARIKNNPKLMDMSNYYENINRGMGPDSDSTKQQKNHESIENATQHEKIRKEIIYIADERKEDEEIWFDVKSPVTFFTGREKELNDLHEALQSDGKAVVSQFHTISHLGGVGKSELARKYISKHCQDYDNKVVWINAESHYTVSKSLQKLALNMLGIVINDNERKEKCIKDLVSEVCSFFSRQKCILILDNAEPTDMNEFLISLPESLSVLVTSSDNQWTNLKVFDLDVFTPKEALEFLKKTFDSKDNEKTENLMKLARTLKYFPLALQQAVAYITVENESISAYLKYWQEKRRDLRKFKVKRDSDNRNPYFKTTLITCDITLDTIRKQSNGGVILKVLNTIAYLQPEDDLLMMLSNVVSDEDDVKSTIKLLQQYSLVSSTHNDTFFSVHRLVQEVIRSRFEKQYLEVNEKFQKNEPNKLEQDSMKLPYSFIHKLNTDVKYEEGYFHEEQALRSSSGEKAIDIPVNNIDCLKEAKLEVYAKVYGEQEKTLDTDRPYTQKLFSDTALALKNTREFNQAFEKNKKLKDKGDITLGLDSLITLNDLSDKAYGLHMEGKYDEALKVRHIVYERKYTILGFDHSNTLTALRDIAATLYKQGKYNEALKCIDQVCERQEGILEPSDALITLMHKAVILDKQSEHKKAKEIYQQIHEKMTVILGPNHARTLTALSSLARAHSNIGQYVDALKIYTEVYHIKRNTLGPNHLDTLFASFDRAVVLSRLGHNDEAFPLYLYVHKELKRQLGPDDETVLTIRRYMAKIGNE